MAMDCFEFVANLSMAAFTMDERLGKASNTSPTSNGQK